MQYEQSQNKDIGLGQILTVSLLAKLNWPEKGLFKLTPNQKLFHVGTGTEPRMRVTPL